MARPRKKIDPAMVKALAQRGAKITEIAAAIGCSHDTLERRFASEIAKGREDLKMSLREWQIQAAKKGNVAMLIWLGKQHLDQRDKASHEHSGPDGRPIETRDMSKLTDEQLDARIAKYMNEEKE